MLPFQIEPKFNPKLLSDRHPIIIQQWTKHQTLVSVCELIFCSICFHFRAYLNWHVIHDEHSNGERHNQMKLSIHLLQHIVAKAITIQWHRRFVQMTIFPYLVQTKLFRKEKLLSMVCLYDRFDQCNSDKSFILLFYFSLYFRLLFFIEHKKHIELCNEQLSKQNKTKKKREHILTNKQNVDQAMVWNGE